MIHRGVAAFALFSAAVYFASSLVAADVAARVVDRTGFLAAILSLAWLVVVAAVPLLRTINRHRATVLFAIPSAVLVHLYQPHVFKIEPDEYVIGATAKHMATHGRASTVVEAWRAPEGQAATSLLVDKRPLAFPALVALVHATTGYRPENAIYLNAALATLVVFLTCLLGYHLAGWPGMTVGALFWPAVPIAHYVFTSGGNDTLSLLLLLGTGLATAWYMRAPSIERLSGAAASIVLFCQVRPESPLLALPFGLLVVGQAIQANTELPRILWLAPILLIPTLLIHSLSGGEVWNTELDLNRVGERFSLGYLADNWTSAKAFLFSSAQEFPNAPFLAFLAAAGLPCVLLQAATDRREPAVAVAGAVLVTAVLFSAVSLGYFFGQWTNPVVARTTLPVFAGMFISVALLCRFIQLRTRPRLAWFVPTFCFGALLAAQVQLRPLQYEPPAQVLTRTLDKLQRESGHGSLWITADPAQAVVNGCSGVTIERANAIAYEIIAARNSNRYSSVLLVRWYERRGAVWLSTDSQFTGQLPWETMRVFQTADWKVEVRADRRQR